MDNKIVGHLAVWGLRLALIAPVIMLIAGGLYRLRFVDFQIPLLAFAAAVLLAALAALFGLIGAVSGALGVHDKTIRAVVALAVALLVLVGPLNTLRQGAGAPMIHDITTDLEDPPIFVEVPENGQFRTIVWILMPRFLLLRKPIIPTLGRPCCQWRKGSFRACA